MAVEILFNTIQEYAYPLIEACGMCLDPYGYIVDKASGAKLCYKNPRYVEGDDVSEVSPVLYPVIPLKDSDYLDIKDKLDTELFNPFTNIKHMIVIAVKLKHLAAVSLNPELLKTAVDEDDWEKFDEYIGLSNDINSMGQIDYALVDLSLPEKPEILRYVCPPDEPVKGLWALCVEIYNSYISQRPPYLKQFQDIDKSWKKIVAAMKKWDKLRKGIVAEIRKEDNQSMNVECMDLSESVTPGEAINIYTMERPLTADDFLMCEDGSDMNGQQLQDFLTSLFNKDSLKPYVEPVEADDEVETLVTPIPVSEKLGFEKMKDVDMTPIKKSEAIVQQPIVEEPPKVEVPTNSIFKKKSSTPNQQNTLNFNNPGMYGNMFGQNPMMGMPGMGMMKPTASMNMDDLCLGDIINPFSSYY